jgi:hypothetical protein
MTRHNDYADDSIADLKFTKEGRRITPLPARSDIRPAGHGADPKEHRYPPRGTPSSIPKVLGNRYRWTD